MRPTGCYIAVYNSIDGAQYQVKGLHEQDGGETKNKRTRLDVSIVPRLLPRDDRAQVDDGVEREVLHLRLLIGRMSRRRPRLVPLSRVRIV